MEIFGSASPVSEISHLFCLKTTIHESEIKLIVHYIIVYKEQGVVLGGTCLNPSFFSSPFQFFTTCNSIFLPLLFDPVPV